MKIHVLEGYRRFGLFLLAGGILTTSVCYARSSRTRQIPRCTRPIGTVAVEAPKMDWWTQMNLESPAALIKVYVARSRCFTLVDRGAGLQAAEAERSLAANGEERVGSNVGKGQMRAADYVLIPDIANRNSNAGGNHVGGLLAGFLPHAVGAVVGGISLHKKTASVVLTLTDVRSTEQVALEEGHASKSDIGWMGGGDAGFFNGFAAGGASGYSNTDIGQVISMAYLNAYAKMVADLQKNTPNPTANNVQQAVQLTEPTKLYSAANPRSSVVRRLKPGMMLYPTGKKFGVWWEVTDELGNVGWVLSTKLQLAK